MGHDSTGETVNPDEPRGTGGRSGSRRGGRHAARARSARRRDRIPLIAIAAALVAAVAVVPLLGSGSDEAAPRPAGGPGGRTPAVAETTPAPTGWGGTGNGEDTGSKAESARPTVDSTDRPPSPSSSPSTGRPDPDRTSSSSPTHRPRRGRCKDGRCPPPWERD